MRKERTEQEKKIKDLREQIGNLTDEKKSTSHELSKKNESIKESEKELKEAKIKIEELENQVSRLKSELEVNERNHKEADLGRAELAARIDELEKIVAERKAADERKMVREIQQEEGFSLTNEEPEEKPSLQITGMKNVEIY